MTHLDMTHFGIDDQPRYNEHRLIRDDFDRHDAFYGLSMLSISLAELNLFVDGMGIL